MQRHDLRIGVRVTDGPSHEWYSKPPAMPNESPPNHSPSTRFPGRKPGIDRGGGRSGWMDTDLHDRRRFVQAVDFPSGGVGVGHRDLRSAC